MNNPSSRALRAYHAATLCAYAVALAACFICDVALHRALTWFPVVLASILLAFCVTNLPLLVRRERLVSALAGVTVSLLLLLFSVARFLGDASLFAAAAAIAAFPLAIAWLGALTLRARRVGGTMKAAVVLMLLGVLVACMNPWVECVLSGAAVDLRLFWNFEFDVVERAGHYAVNFLVGLGLMVAGAVTAAAAVARRR